MVLKLKQLRIGKIDGKHEYLTPASERDSFAFDNFLIPESVEPDRMHNGDTYFVEGFRARGKLLYFDGTLTTVASQGA